GEFVGLKNYIDLFSDPYFYQALGNTFKLLLFVPFCLNALALTLAFLVTQTRLRERGFYRFLFFFPSIISATALGVLWSNIYSPTLGIVKKLGELLGISSLQSLAVLGNQKTVLIAVGVVMVWQSVGYYMVMYIASIDGIDTSVFEAATMDGCGIIKKIVYITLPILRNMISVTFVLSLSSALAMSYIITSVMTAGGPSGSSTVILYYMYKQAFEQSNFGYAMSVAVVTLILAFLLSKLSRCLTAERE
ncbi:carbohydrate ABC transporter permease, partial [Hungatella effluvii]